MSTSHPTGLNVIVDISHHNGLNLDFNKARLAGIQAIIHKSSQGLRYRDPMYLTNKHRALDAGMLWGAYHYGTNERGMAQADFFLEAVKPDKHTLLVLDYEPNYSPQSTMKLEDAREFVETVAANNDDWYPVLYSGHLIKEQLNGKPADQVLSQCPLWIAQYGPKVTNIPIRTWKTWSFWQYTDHGFVDGLGWVDRDRFNGDADGLRRMWGY